MNSKNEELTDEEIDNVFTEVDTDGDAENIDKNGMYPWMHAMRLAVYASYVYKTGVLTNHVLWVRITGWV